MEREGELLSEKGPEKCFHFISHKLESKVESNLGGVGGGEKSLLHMRLKGS